MRGMHEEFDVTVVHAFVATEIKGLVANQICSMSDFGPMRNAINQRIHFRTKKLEMSLDVKPRAVCFRMKVWLLIADTQLKTEDLSGV